MGPNLLFHLAGGSGGIHHFMEHSPASSLMVEGPRDHHRFSPQVKQAIIDGVQKEAGNRSVDELNRERDAMLLECLLPAQRVKRRPKLQSPEDMATNFNK